MDSLRGVSQFATSDLASKQAEFQKRFGLPIPEKDMFVDFPPKYLSSSGFMEAGFPSKGPRLPKDNDHAEKQCRERVIPIKVENAEESILQDDAQQPEIDSTSTPPEVVSQGPRVRNIPILVEGQQNQRMNIPFPVESQPSQKMNIPFIHKQGSEVPDVKKAKSTPQKPASKFNVNSKKTSIATQKQPTSSNCNKPPTEEGPERQGFSAPIVQIQTVLNKLAKYEVEVNSFTGTSKDKQYRFLDEMLTRCMIELDDVDTMGNTDVRAFRKSAVKKIQACADLLDSKICIVESADPDAKNCAVVHSEHDDMKMGLGDCADSTESCVSVQSDRSSEIENVEEDLSQNIKNVDESTRLPNEEVKTLTAQVEVVAESIEPDDEKHPEETIKQDADSSTEDMQIDQTVSNSLVNSLKSTVGNNTDSELDSSNEIAMDFKPECDQHSVVVQAGTDEARETEN